MNLRLRRATMALAFVAIAGGLVGACGETAGTDPGTGSHFLESCDAACGPGLACLSGVCTTTCARDADCTKLAATSTCIDSASSSTPGTCDVLCKSDADCTSVEAAGHCASGRCRSTSAGGPHPGTDGGAGGATSGNDGGVGTAGALDSGGAVGAAGAEQIGGTQASGGTEAASGAPADGGAAGAGPRQPESSVHCTYARTINCNDCGALPAPATISVGNVPVSLGAGVCGLQTQGSLPTPTTSCVLIDAPMVFGAWINSPFTNSFSVVDAASHPGADVIWPGAEWVGQYGPAPAPAGSGSGLITITGGEASISINMSSQPSNGTFACNPMTHGTHGCVVQTIACNGTAVIPEFVK